MLQYTVKTGDTLYLLAQRFNTTVERILQLNPSITDPSNISVGQVILIPGEGAAQTPVQIPAQIRVSLEGKSYSTRIVDGLLYILATDRFTYRQGQNIQLTLIKCNITNRTLTLNYNTSQRYDFAAVRDGREVWRWSNNQFFAQVTGRVTLRPGQCQSYSVVWNQLNNAGRQVAADVFQIRAFNVARGFANEAVEQAIRITAGPAPGPTLPPAPEPCSQRNLLANSGFENWDSQHRPNNWQVKNVYRTELSKTGNYAAELGAAHNREATLSQTVAASEGRIYQLEFSARENVQPGEVSKYQLRAEVFFYNRAGELVGRADPVISESAIPDNSYQLYTLTTGITPRTTVHAEVRFTFIPDPNNDNTVKIDSVAFFCLR